MPDPQALPEICPFLISAEDADSVFNYASAHNRCNKIGGQMPIAPDYQTSYCLRTRHWFCPVFTGAVKKPPIPIRFEGPTTENAGNTGVSATAVPHLDKLPTVPITEPYHAPNPRAQLVWLLVLLALAGTAVGIGLKVQQNNLMNLRADQPTLTVATSVPPPTLTPEPSTVLENTSSPTAGATETLTSSPTETPTDSQQPTASATQTPSPTATQTATPDQTATSSMSSTLKACVAPANWQTYTVAPGETYFKIATKFSTTVEALQRVNCLADPGRLLAGQVIKVPPAP